MNIDEVHHFGNLERYGIGTNDLEIVLSELPEYAIVTNKGEFEKQRENPLDKDTYLEDDEVPDPTRRDGESSLGIGYSDFEVHYAGLAGEVDFDVPEDQRLDLPEENKEQALGALFGASYALLRSDVMDNGLSADHSTFKQDIDSEEERERFFEEGALEIKGEIMGQWGYDHKLMNEIMDPEQALETYNNVAQRLV